MDFPEVPEILDSDSDESSSLSELEAEFQTLLKDVGASITSEKINKEVDEILEQYGEHGTKQRLQASISKFLKDNKHYGDLEVTHQGPELQDPQGGERTHDPDAASLASSLPFHLRQTFKLPPNTYVKPEIVSEINTIFELQQLEGEVLLAYYCKKYGPEAIWRTGIRAMILSRTEDLLRAPVETYLGLNADQRMVLSQAFEEFPIINTVERRLLCRAANVHPAVIDEYWRVSTKKKMSYMAMQVVATAKEARKKARKYNNSGIPVLQHDHLNMGMDQE